MEFSVIVPGYNAAKTLPKLFESLSQQSFMDFEIIFVDDCSRDNTPSIARASQCRLFRMKMNQGPAHCRNVGAGNAKGDILVFTDSDCRVDQNWLENMRRHFSLNDAEAIMGKLTLLPSTFLGDSISALGFPAGGAIGFDKIWKVDPKGYTDSLSSCNCAIKKGIFREIGGFDETFPYAGGEDSLLAYNLRRLNYRIKYCPDVLVYHGARDSFSGFLKWQFRRGVSSFIFSTKVTNKSDFFSLRMWSTRNIIRSYYRDRKFPLIFFLLCASVCMQSIGFFFAKQKKETYASTNN
jgi:glycosyltransferase involved in cell wall biosynthesis